MKMKIGKTLRSLSASVLMLGVATIASAETLKIALAGPVTGPVAQYGEMQFIGAKMAIEQINKAGGILGKQQEGVVYDDA